MYNPERLLDGHRGGITRRKVLLALAALGGGMLVQKLSGKLDVNGNVSTLSADNESAPNTAPHTENGEYRKLRIIKADDPLLEEATQVRFQEKPENLLDEINERAQETGYLSFRSGKFADKILLPTPIGQDLEKELIESVKKIDSRVSKNGQHISLVLFVYELGDNARLNGTGYAIRSTGKNVIELSVSPNVDVTIGELKVVTNNEANHIDYRANHSDLNDSDELGIFYEKFMEDAENETIAQTSDPNSVLFGQDIVRVLNRSPRDLRTQIRATADNALFHVFMEKSYLGEGGHPWDGSEELFTSTITVLDLFPNSFMATTSNLAPEDQRLIKEFGKFVVDKVGADRFSINLIKFLKV